MNFLSVFQKRNKLPNADNDKLTNGDNQMDKLTLDSAREQIAAQATEIQGLQSRIAEFETNSFFTDLRISRTETNGTVVFASGVLEKLTTDLTTLTAEKTDWEAEKVTLTAAATQAATDLAAAQAQVADLSKKDMNADLRAAERLAGLNGKPLQIAGNQEPDVSLTEISLKADAANAAGNTVEANRLYKLYETRKSGKS